MLPDPVAGLVLAMLGVGFALFSVEAGVLLMDRYVHRTDLDGTDD